MPQIHETLSRDSLNPLVLTPFGRHQLRESIGTNLGSIFADLPLQSISVSPYASNTATFSRYARRHLGILSSPQVPDSVQNFTETNTLPVFRTESE